MNKQYIESLKAITAIDEEEQNDIDKTIQWLELSKNVHKPENMEVHLGVLAYIVSEDYKSIFLLNHKKAMTWLPPGWHVDKGLSLRDAIILEIREELDVDAIFHLDNAFFHTRVTTIGKNAWHIDVTFWFILQWSLSDTYKVQEKEASDSGWFLIEDVLVDKNFQHLHRGVKKLTEILSSKIAIQ